MGFAEAREGESFIKIGVGLLRKGHEEQYQFHGQYEILRAGTWNIEHGPIWVNFNQELQGDRGWAYRYRKRIALVAGRPEFTIEHRLENTGKKAIDINPEAESVVAKAIIKSPGALINFNKPEYTAKIARNPEKWKPMLEKSIDAVRRTTMAHYMIENGGIPTNFDIQGLRDGFSPNPPTIEELRSATRYRATGDGIDGVMQSNINMIRAVAQKNPMLWEGEHESALDYIRSIFNIESGVRQNDKPSGE